MNWAPILFTFFTLGRTDLFYPYEQVTVFNKFVNEEMVIHIGMDFKNITHYIEALDKLTMKEDIAAMTKQSRDLINPLPYHVKQLDIYVEELIAEMNELEGEYQILNVAAPFSESCHVNFSISGNQQKQEYDAILTALTSYVTEFKALLETHKKNLKEATDTPVFKILVLTFQLVNERIRNLLEEVRFFSDNLISLTRSLTLDDKMLRDASIKQCHDSTHHQSILKFNINDCYYITDQKTVSCHAQRLQMFEKEQYTHFKPYVYFGCSLDLYFVAKSLTAPKYDISHLPALIPLSTENKCIDAIENNNIDDVISYCPKRFDAKSYEVTSFGLALFELSQNDRAQFPEYITSQLKPPVFLSFSGPKSYQNINGVLYNLSYHSGKTLLIKPDYSFTESQICPEPIVELAIEETILSYIPGSAVTLITSGVLGSLIFLVRKLYLKIKQGRQQNNRTQRRRTANAATESVRLVSRVNAQRT